MGKNYFTLMFSTFGTILGICERTLIATGEPKKTAFNYWFVFSIGESAKGCFLPHILLIYKKKLLLSVGKPAGFDKLFKETDHAVDESNVDVTQVFLKGGSEVTLRRGSYVRDYLSGRKEKVDAWIITGGGEQLSTSTRVVPLTDTDGSPIDPVAYLNAVSAVSGEIQDLMNAEKGSVLR